MAAAKRPWARGLLHTWFHELTKADWFGGGAGVDTLLRRRFERALLMLGGRSAQEFLCDKRTAQAAILLFDQVPRNLYRDTALAFAWDPLALRLTHGFLGHGWHEDLPREARQFVFMPLMHSEEVTDQLLSLALFARHVPGSLSFARSHHRMIARFGRFPHRNGVLGRKTTAAEQRAIDAGFTW